MKQNRLAVEPQSAATLPHDWRIPPAESSAILRSLELNHLEVRRADLDAIRLASVPVELRQGIGEYR